MRKTISGFTIIELLVVITVISILAAISIAAFNGVQARTRNAQRIATANQFVKIIQLYQTTYGTSPFTSHTCLGEGYPDLVDNDGIGDCYDFDFPARLYHSDAATMTRLKQESPNLPRQNMSVITSTGGNRYLGIAAEVSSKNIDGTPFQVQLIYYLEGANADCQSNGTLINGSWPNFTKATKNSASGANLTFCFVYVPNP